MGTIKLTVVSVALGSLIVAGTIWAAEAPADKQRLISEACAMISQQRNSLSDAVAVAEANRKIEGEELTKIKQRLAEWDAYFKAYVGESGK